MTIGRPRSKRLRFWDKVMDPIALSLNTRPRARHQFQSPFEVYNAQLQFSDTCTGITTNYYCASTLKPPNECR